MKVTHVSGSLSRAAGGIFEIEMALAKGLHELGVLTDVVGLFDDGWLIDYSRWTPLNAKACPIAGFRAFGYSQEMRNHLVTANYDIVHLHTLWMYPSVAVFHSAKALRKPYVITPNGMLEPWALRNSEWKKKIAGWLYETRTLSQAACLQANTMKELRDFRAYGLRNPVAIIPNGVELARLDSATWKPERKILLFLGRLHPKKGLPNALRAWKKIKDHQSDNGCHEDWQFLIAGWDQGGHEAELKLLCDEIGLAYDEVPASEFAGNRVPTVDNGASVLFVGPAFGRAKELLFRQAAAFILPSFSEGLPMAILEAWSYGLPALMTDECNLPEGFSADAALRIGTDVESIVDGLRVLFSLPATDSGNSTRSLSSVGHNGRLLVESQFSWPMVAAQMKQVYEWLLGGGPKPDCVHGPR